MNRPVSVGAALIAGFIWVQAPIVFFFAGPLCVLALYSSNPLLSGLRIPLVFVCLAAGFVLAWVWWNLTVPKWRVWAYEHVRNVPQLRRWAVAVGLSWTDGCLIVLTEKPPETQPLPLPPLNLDHASKQEKQAH